VRKRDGKERRKRGRGRQKKKQADIGRDSRK